MHGTRVLVVEDDVPLRRTIVDLLVGWGHQVETAADGADAWKKLPSFDPLIVISDLSPPRMLTPELVRAIRRGVPDVSCIVLTESPHCHEALQAVENGARALIEKTADAEQLKVQLEACLQGAPLLM